MLCFEADLDKEACSRKPAGSLLCAIGVLWLGLPREARPEGQSSLQGLVSGGRVCLHFWGCLHQLVHRRQEPTIVQAKVNLSHVSRLSRNPINLQQL